MSSQLNKAKAKFMEGLQARAKPVKEGIGGLAKATLKGGLKGAAVGGLVGAGVGTIGADAAKTYHTNHHPKGQEAYQARKAPYENSKNKFAPYLFKAKEQQAHNKVVDKGTLIGGAIGAGIGGITGAARGAYKHFKGETPAPKPKIRKKPK